MDDSITDAILGGEYQRIRVERRVYLRYPLPRKVAWQSYMLLSIAAVFPLVAFLPAGVREQYLPVVATSTPKIAFVILFGLVLTTTTAVGHLFVAWRTRDGVDEATASDLVTLENACSLLGFATAGVAVGVSHAFVLLGYGPLDAYVALGGGNPFVSSPIAPPLWAVTLLALVLGVCLRTAAAWAPTPT